MLKRNVISIFFLSSKFGSYSVGSGGGGDGYSKYEKTALLRWALIIVLTAQAPTRWYSKLNCIYNSQHYIPIGQLFKHIKCWCVAESANIYGFISMIQHDAFLHGFMICISKNLWFNGHKCTLHQLTNKTFTAWKHHIAVSVVRYLRHVIEFKKKKSSEQVFI